MSDRTAIEVRIKELGTPWELLPHITIDLEASALALPQDPEETTAMYLDWLQVLAHAITDGIAIGEDTEVRWNWVGSYQGHYTRG